MSDRARLPDNELVEALACLVNTDGGELWLGVEDDGTGRSGARTSMYVEYAGPVQA